MERGKVRLLLTRPEAASNRFAQQLRDRIGEATDIMISPLLGIEYRRQKPDFKAVKGLIFSSANGVHAIADHLPDLPAYVVGKATAAALEAIGSRTQSMFPDANRLVDGLRETNPETPLLHVRGQYTQGDIASRLAQSGIEVREFVAYDQPGLPFTTEARAALECTSPVVAPIFSVRTAQQFVSQGPFTAPLFLAAISPAVAAELRDLNPKRLDIAVNPDAQDMAEATARLVAAAAQLEDPEPPK